MTREELLTRYVELKLRGIEYALLNFIPHGYLYHHRLSDGSDEMVCGAVWWSRCDDPTPCADCDLLRTWLQRGLQQCLAEEAHVE